MSQGIQMAQYKGPGPYEEEDGLLFDGADRGSVNEGLPPGEVDLFPSPGSVLADKEKSLEVRRARLKQGIGLVVTTALAGVIWAVPILESNPTAHRCLALLVWTAILWTTELLPIWVTSLCVPLLVVVMRVLPPAPGQEYSAAAAASTVMGQMIGEAVLLAFAAFTMSLTVTKYQLSQRLALIVMRRVPKKPMLVMLALMFLAWFLSMWISNVASPVVVLALVQPSLASLPAAHNDYAKCLLLGIAYASNIGGMTTPIASPQNIFAMSVDSSLGWGNFCGVGIPFSIICVFISWGFLYVWYRPKLEVLDLQLDEESLEPFNIWHCLVLITCGLTITLWALNDLLDPFFGGNGMPSLIPIIVFFGFGFLKGPDLKECKWDVLLLLAGGLVLGNAISLSTLLMTIADSISTLVSDVSIWVVLLAFGSLTWLFGNFVSHTVAAEIILPVVASVGASLAQHHGGKSYAAFLVVGSVLLDSGAMGLPVSSFPNVQAFALMDPQGKQFLETKDFIKTGFLIGVIELVLLLSLGYGLLLAVF